MNKTNPVKINQKIECKRCGKQHIQGYKQITCECGNYTHFVFVKFIEG